MNVPYNLPLTVRRDVRDFAALMEHNLKRKNNEHGGYQDGHPLAVFAKLGEEFGDVAELLIGKFYAWDGVKYGPMKKSDHDLIIDECVDVANVAMMLVVSLLELRAEAMSE